MCAQVQALRRTALLSPSLLYLLAGLLGAPLEGPWVCVGPPWKRGPPLYIDRCKLAAGLFKVVEAAVGLLNPKAQTLNLKPQSPLSLGAPS